VPFAHIRSKTFVAAFPAGAAYALPGASKMTSANSAADTKAVFLMPRSPFVAGNRWMQEEG